MTPDGLRTYGRHRLRIDERRGRTIAHKVYGLQVKGTAGLLVEAYRRGLVDDVRTILLDLRRDGYYLSDAVIEAARLAAC